MDPNKKLEGTCLNAKEKKEFLEATSQIQKELEKCQREYKKVVSMRLKKKKDRIIEKSYKIAIRSLKEERNHLKAQIWVANGKLYEVQDDHYYELIKCHIECQEYLVKDIKELKENIRHLEITISHEDKSIYRLNRETVPDSQHQDFVKCTRAKLAILENRLEVGIRRESGFAAANAELREELVTLLEYREFFNNAFLKLITKLNTDKKYLVELLNYANNTFEDCINLHEKIEHIYKKKSKESDNIKADMQSEIRKSLAEVTTFAFIEVKNATRELAPISQKEIARREAFTHAHVRKINLYNNVLNKLKFGKSGKVDEVIENFQNQENAYYSFYTLAIEMSYHITLLKNAVNRLYGDIGDLKISNTRRSEFEVDKVSDLQDIYDNKKKNNSELSNQLEKENFKLENLFREFTDLFNMSRCNAAPLMMLLGNHTKINMGNLQKFLKILEARMYDIIAAVYVRERKAGVKNPDKYVVKYLVKFTEQPTRLDDIVLTQQCPECAEGEAYNIDDVAGDIVNVQSVEESKKKLYERINQPEMQYRLHSISQCRLPRSHILASKRNL